MDIRRVTTASTVPTNAQAEAVAAQSKNSTTPSVTTNLTNQAVDAVDASAKTKDAEENKEGKALDQDALKQSVEETNKSLQMMATSLELSIDNEGGAVVAKVIDKDTNKVIRQIPSEEMIELAKRVEEFKSLLTSQKA